MRRVSRVFELTSLVVVLLVASCAALFRSISGDMLAFVSRGCWTNLPNSRSGALVVWCVVDFTFRLSLWLFSSVSCQTLSSRSIDNEILVVQQCQLSGVVLCKHWSDEVRFD